MQHQEMLGFLRVRDSTCVSAHHENIGFPKYPLRRRVLLLIVFTGASIPEPILGFLRTA
jgi:hypothetical protein